MNKDKNGTTSNIQSSSAGESSSGKTKSINVNLSPWPKKTKVGVLLDDNKYNDSVGIGVNPNTRHNTCQDINQPSQFAESMANLTTGRRLSLSASTNSTRKSFLGEIKSRLSFNKKQEGLPGEPSSSQQQQQDENSSIPCDRVLVVKEFEKENKKLALPLQGRRKQVFQKQENGSDNGNASNLPSFTTVCCLGYKYYLFFQLFSYFFYNTKKFGRRLTESSNASTITCKVPSLVDDLLFCRQKIS